MLSEYMKLVQGFIRDRDQRFVNPDDIRRYINMARKEIALRTASVRVITPISGQVVTATITAAGTGYVTPVATISDPDFPDNGPTNPNGAQATANVQQIGGVISQIDITYGGSGYFQPTITITDSTGPGTGATATLTVSPLMQTVQGQEVYTFDQIPLGNFPGVAEVFWVNSVSILYAAYRFSLLTYSFSTYQAQIRNWPRGYQYCPSICAQLGRGTKGSLYLYPVSSQAFQLEFDCYCLPSDLNDDTDYEAIPGPWTECVSYFATHLAFLELQNLNAARFYLELHDQRVDRYSAWTAPRKVSNRYGRWAWLPFMLPIIDALHHFAAATVSAA